MTQNIQLTPTTQKDIDQRIERVLRGLGNPEPPLRLEDVRELLRLDLKFYTADDPGIAKEALSRICIATVQIFNRPTIIFDAIKKFSLKALYIPDKKRILLDGDIPKLKHRWNEAHEIGHSLIPWHDALMHGDNDQTLSRGCEAQVEAEANFAAGRLLFLRERFVEEARSSAPGIQTVRSLHGIYGNTLSTTLYRFVESIDETVPAIGMMTGHPHKERRAKDFDASNPCKHFIVSEGFRARFKKISAAEIFAAVTGYCGKQGGGILGSAELVLTDDNGIDHRFQFETFFNRYDALTLGVHLGKKTPLIGRI